MITLANNNIFDFDLEIVRKYHNTIPAVIFAYINSLGDGLHELTNNDLLRILHIKESVQNKWIKQMVKDKLIDIEYRGIHNKRYLGIR